MNSISWLVYLIGVAENVGWGFHLLFILFTGVTILWVLAGAIFLASDEYEPGFWKVWRRCASVILPSLVVSWLAMSLFPSRQTLVLIAGSQIGEQVIKSENVQSLVNPGMDLLKSWIKNETYKLTKKAD